MRETTDQTERPTRHYTIGEIEELSGVKAHTLRYWEEVIPSIAPKKSIGGLREYTDADLETILRLKHLIYEKKFTIEGARNQILTEAPNKENFPEAMKELREIRETLSDLYLTVRKHR